MEVQFSPNSVDDPNLLYKLQRKLKVFNASPLQNRGYNLITSSSKYGLVFIASPEGLISVYYLKDLVNKECEIPPHLLIRLQESPTHISVSCDQELLVVSGGRHLNIYKITQFQEQNVLPSLSIPCQSQSYISSLQWNPCIPDVIAVAFFDGSLLVAAVYSNQVKMVQAKARCVCWSPKGKQVVVGNSDGTLCQYKPDLSLMKTVPAPNLFEGAPVECLAIHWISTFQFVVVYRNSADDSRPSLTIVNTPKGGQPVCINYEDICYSMNNDRPWFYYLHSIAQWNMVLAASSNSVEIATLGSSDSTNWIQWTQNDEARPELPLSGKVDNYPVGLCIDTCAIHQVPWGENETLPFMPLLLVVSHTGLLTIYNIINLNNNAPQLCTPPQQIVLPEAIMTKAVLETQQQIQPVSQATELAKPSVLITAKSEEQAPPPSSQVVLPTITPTKAEYVTPITTPVPIRVASVEPRKQAEIKPLPPQPLPVQAITPTIPKNDDLPPLQPQALAQIPSSDKTDPEEKERSTINANYELNRMTIKEMNDFQMELHTFMKKSYAVQMQYAKQVSEAEPCLDLSNLNTESLRKECWLDEIKEAVVQLKLELVRACAVVAEIRTYNETKDLDHWSQPDPLTAKRLASIKNSLYYLECQLERANKELQNKVAQITQYNDRSGPRMIRPILDDVYQPLVKQQEILSRQEAVLKVIKNTLNQCDILPWKGTSLLRSTPFKKDQMSKLTKNLLEMNIEPTEKKSMSCGLTPPKLEALRDMLVNHKTVRIQPVNVEMREHYSTLRSNYEKALKEKVMREQLLKQSNAVKVEPKPVVQNKQIQEKVHQVPPKPTTTPTVNSVVKNLFSDDADKQHKPLITSNIPNTFGAVSANASTVAAKPQVIEIKNDANTFMGQKICSPSVTKPITSVPTTFTPFQPTSIFAPKENKPQPSNIFPTKSLSAETGEHENSFKGLTKTVDDKTVIPKQIPAFATTQNIPDVVKTDKIKAEKVEVPTSTQRSEILKPVATSANSVSTENKSSLKVSIPIPQKVETNKENVATSPTASSIFAAANKSSPGAQSPLATSPTGSIFSKSPNSTGSIFGFNLAPKSIFGSTITPTTAAAIKTDSPVDAQSTPKTTCTNADKVSVTTTASNIPTSSTESTKPVTSDVTTSLTQSKISTSTEEANTSTTVSTLTTTSATFGSPTSQADISISKATTPISQPSIFGSSFTTKASFGSTTTTSASIFGSQTSQAPLFGSTQQSSIFGKPTATTTSSIFGASPTTTQSSIFGASSTTTQSPAFGSVTTTASQGSGFSSATTSTTQSSIFGSSATPPKTQGSIFGSPTATATTQSSIFGSQTTPTTTSSIFGSSSAPATTQTSIFGSPATPATTQTSIFGSPATTQTSIFGSPSSPATTQTSIFGSPATTQTSIFGSPTTATTQSSIFGTATTTQTSIFGSSTQPATTQSSIFGSSSPSIFGGQGSTPSSIFGKANENANKSSPFGGAETSMFAAASISTTTASPTNAGNIFGGGDNKSGSGFGGGSIFGSKPAFGQSPQTNAFGGGTTFGQTPPATNLFGGATNTTGFGSSAFGQQTPNQKSVFGSPSGFGGSFSGGNTSQGFGTPTQQTGGFGASPQQNAGAFGGSGFGAKPAFGQPTGFGAFSNVNKSPTSGFGSAATFGGSPAFGSAATFGSTSPGKVFGSSSPGFGQPTQTNMTFESLATQDTLSFGNLAQQTQQEPAKPAFNTSPSFTGWRG